MVLKMRMEMYESHSLLSLLIYGDGCQAVVCGGDISLRKCFCQGGGINKQGKKSWLFNCPLLPIFLVFAEGFQELTYRLC